MMKTFLATTMFAAAAIATPAHAVTFFTTDGSTTSFAAPATGGTLVDFNSDTLPTGISLSGAFYKLTTGSVQYLNAAPAFGDNSRYLAVMAGCSETLTSAAGVSSVSAFLGSIDTFNAIQVLSTTGALLGSFTGAQFTTTPDGNQTLATTNRRVTFLAGTGETIGAIRFISGGNAFELDNVVFAVPEPSTWMMMLVGFGLVGGAVRSRRRSSVRVVYA